MRAGSQGRCTGRGEVFYPKTGPLTVFRHNCQGKHFFREKVRKAVHLARTSGFEQAESQSANRRGFLTKTENSLATTQVTSHEEHFTRLLFSALHFHP